MTERLRRRPRNSNTTHKKVARDAFGDAYEKILAIPACIDAYNHHMGGVDIGDQLRSSYSWDHRWRRGPWQPLGWGFLLGTVLVNCYKLHSGFGTWNDANGHFAWRKHLATQLFDAFGPDAKSRQRARPGIFLDRKAAQLPIHLHERGKRGKRAACKVCSAKRQLQKKVPLGERDGNTVPCVGRRVDCGCLTCDVALCPTGPCWDMFHRSKIGHLCTENYREKANKYKSL